jgi:hypothetical protein
MKLKIISIPMTVLILTACSLLQAGNPPAATTQAQVTAVTVNAPSADILLPSATSSQEPISLSEPTGQPADPVSTIVVLPMIQNLKASATEVPVVQATSSPSTKPQLVKIFLIAIEDNGISGEKVGCGDSAVPVQVQIPHTLGVLKAALESLLSIKDQFYGQSGLYNALYQSDLRIKSVSIKEGKATIQLTGSIKLGGECDNPRLLAQLKSTALQFSTVSDAAIFINGKPIEEVLSLN